MTKQILERYNPAIIIASLLAVVLGVIFLWLSWVLNTPSPDMGGGDVMINIEKGMSLEQVTNMLDERGLLRSRSAFKWAARLMGVERKIQSGVFLIPRGATNVEILRYLKRPMSISLNVTIPEGLTIREIAAIFQRQLNIDSSAFIAACYDSALIAELGIQAPSLEGYLFPDTYNLYPEMLPEAIIYRMVNNFNRHISDSLITLYAKHGLNLHQAITLASIVEGEVMIADEAPIVAAVFYNRLRKRMPLEADPTIQYILPEGPRRLFLSDLSIDSPYNTYKYAGLPPGPINNPGLRSLRAVAYPAKVDYIYFVAQGDGSHAFTKSYEEFLIAKQKLQKIRKDLAEQKKRAQG